jgi:hypothetical protein
VVASDPIGTAPSPPLTDFIIPCPYPGLAYFGPQDASRFFGREPEIQALLAAVEKWGFTAVVGPSASGKSSVVLAGLVPSLDAKGGWRSTYFRIGTEPDKDPFAALARALTPLLDEDDSLDRIGGGEKLAHALSGNNISLANVIALFRAKNPSKRVLVIADQFEEVFTLLSDEALRNHFIDAFIAAFPNPAAGTTPDVCLVLTLRADLYDRALRYRSLADKLQGHDVSLGRMSRHALRDAIERPAEALQVRFEVGLVDKILDDLEKFSAALPLLQVMLREMWGRLKSPLITHADYEAVGRVEGVAARMLDTASLDTASPDTASVGFIKSSEAEEIRRNIADAERLREMAQAKSDDAETQRMRRADDAWASREDELRREAEAQLYEKERGRRVERLKRAGLAVALISAVLVGGIAVYTYGHHQISLSPRDILAAAFALINAALIGALLIWRKVRLPLFWALATLGIPLAAALMIDASRGHAMRVILPHAAPIAAMAVSGDESLLAVVDQDGFVGVARTDSKVLNLIPTGDSAKALYFVTQDAGGAVLKPPQLIVVDDAGDFKLCNLISGRIGSIGPCNIVQFPQQQVQQQQVQQQQVQQQQVQQDYPPDRSITLGGLM